MKKVLQTIKNVLVGIVVFFALCMMIFTIISVTTLDKTDRNFLGFKAFIVLTDSMSATDFKAGDLVIVRTVDPSTLEEGDIISYRSTNLEHYYEVVTHKIGKKLTDRNGRPGFTTYGTTTGSTDDEIVYYENILGKYQITIPKIGVFFQFLKTTPGYIICILMPFLVLILIQALHSIKLFKKYKRETLEEMNDEKRKLENERLEAEQIRQQLELSQKKTQKIERELANLKKELKKVNETESSARKTKVAEKKSTPKKTTKKVTTKEVKKPPKTVKKKEDVPKTSPPKRSAAKTTETKRSSASTSSKAKTTRKTTAKQKTKIEKGVSKK